MNQSIKSDGSTRINNLNELLVSIQQTIRYIEASDSIGIETETRCQENLLEKIHASNPLTKVAALDTGDGGTRCHSDEFAVRSALAHQVKILQLALQRSSRSLSILHQLATSSDGTYSSVVQVRS